MTNRKQEQAAQVRLQYPPGTRLELIQMEGQYADIPPGMRGTVDMVDDAANIHMIWDNGRTLSLLPGVDQFRRLTQQELAEEGKITITQVTTEELRTMWNREALVLQGCGGDLEEWVNGINDMLVEQGVLKQNSRFRNVLTFQNNGVTNLAFPLEDAEVDVGKLSIWRIQTVNNFNGIWLSDYVYNQLDGFISQEPGEEIREKPDCPLIGADGNIFNLMGIARRTLKEHGMAEEAREMCDRITQSDSYGAALSIIGEYVNITSVADMSMDDMNMDEIK